MAGKTLQLDIKIDGKLDPSVTAAFGKLSTMANKANKNMLNAKITDSVNRMAGVSQRIMGTVLKAAAVAGAAIGIIGGRSVKLASDLAEVQNVVDVTFGKNAQQVNAWSKTMLDSYGMSELSAKKYSSTMGAMLKSSGVSDERLLKMSQDMTQLTGDFASFYNLDSEEAFNKIRAGISGETEPLKQLGINMSVANLEAFAMSKGIAKAYSSMTQAEQAMLRYNYLLGVSKDAQGDFTRTQAGFANQMRLAKEKTDQLLISIGEKLLPQLTPLIQKFNDFISTIKPETLEKIGKNISDIAMGGLQTMQKIFTTLSPIAMGLFNFLKDHGDLVKAVLLGVAVAFGVLTAAQIAFNIAAWANPVNLIILGVLVAIALLVAGFYLMWTRFESFRIIAGAVFNFIKIAFMNAFMIFKPIIDGIIMTFQGLITFITGVFTGNWRTAFQGIADMVKGIFSTIAGYLKLPLNGIIAGINTLIGGANLIGGALGIQIPLIPYLAKGATVTSPMLAMIGEAGTETVVPHNNSPRSQALALTAAKGAGLSMGGNSIVFSPNIYCSGSGSDVKQALKDGFEEFKAMMDRYGIEKERVSYGT